jgi:hypothetical protein
MTRPPSSFFTLRSRLIWSSLPFAMAQDQWKLRLIRDLTVHVPVVLFLIGVSRIFLHLVQIRETGLGYRPPGDTLIVGDVVGSEFTNKSVPVAIIVGWAAPIFSFDGWAALP